MIVPRYWAEERLQHREGRKQITVRRFGWSDISQNDAESHARQRAASALEQLRAGVPLARREPRVAYNGATGVPIREEIISTHGDVVITRNNYGAKCLNTPNVFFADIDFPEDPGALLTGQLIGMFSVIAAVIGWQSGSLLAFFAMWVAGLVISFPVTSVILRILKLIRGDPEIVARKQIDRFLFNHPDWHLRLYRTPAGLRILALHQTFDPADPAVEAAFQELQTDRIYVSMCLRQNCFRARVSPKPWRIGIEKHIRPVKATWPIAPENLPQRKRWIEQYEATAQNYASCTYLEDLGSPAIDAKARAVMDLHDELCQVTSPLPIA